MPDSMLLNQPVIPTGIEPLDNQVSGGFKRGEMVAFAASSGTGRSMFEAFTNSEPSSLAFQASILEVNVMQPLMAKTMLGLELRMIRIINVRAVRRQRLKAFNKRKKQRRATCGRRRK